MPVDHFLLEYNSTVDPEVGIHWQWKMFDLGGLFSWKSNTEGYIPLISHQNFGEINQPFFTTSSRNYVPVHPYAYVSARILKDLFKAISLDPNYVFDCTDITKMPYNGFVINT